MIYKHASVITSL